jgi:tetratricopeptide (TPR) repeat protein
MYEEALGYFRATGDQKGVSDTLNSIANVLADQGDHTGALRSYNEAIAGARRIGDRENIAIGLGNIGILQAEHGEIRDALSSLQEAADLKRAMGARRSLAYTLTSMGESLVARGQLAAARTTLEEALAIRIELKQEANAAETRLKLAALLIEEGRPREAEVEARSCREALSKSGRMDMVIVSGCVVARALLAQGQAAPAAEAVAEAEELLAGSKNRVANLTTGITAARVRAASAGLEATRSSLRSLIKEAGTSELGALQLEARLALAESEWKWGDQKSAGKQAAALVADARRSGFELIARKAASLK